MLDRTAVLERTMPQGLMRVAVSVLCMLCTNLNADATGDAMQSLSYREALFHYHQNDLFSAITRLEIAGERGPDSELPKESAILLARMKLAFGMDIDAAYDFHALLGEDVPEQVRNRAWFELAGAFHRKGYAEAADEALDSIHGDVPPDIAGDLQLLRAVVYMDLGDSERAAQLLDKWEGNPDKAGYAAYNRGMALLRAGEREKAIAALSQVLDDTSNSEDARALRDRTRLSLAYVHAQNRQYSEAENNLKAVRLNGPYSNRALLALGWIAHKQGRKQEALTPWTELSSRSPTDSAVLEALLVVPAVHRDLDGMQLAERDFEVAVDTYSRELEGLRDTLESVRDGDAVNTMLAQSAEAGDSRARYLGRLLASRNYQVSLQGHNELTTMLKDADQGLRNLERLENLLDGQAAAGRGSPRGEHLPRSGRQATRTASDAGTAGSKSAARGGYRTEPVWVEGGPAGGPAGESTEQASIPRLPEIDLPAGAETSPLPDSGFAGLPDSDFTGLPGEPELAELLQGEGEVSIPETYTAWLPESGVFRLPFDDSDYAYPDDQLASGVQLSERPGARQARMIRPGSSGRGFHGGGEPVGEALRDLALALNSATDRMARLSTAMTAAELEAAGLEERLALVRARILKLRARIEHAIALNEHYTRMLAINELNRRQHQLEKLLERASLELAKTYDQSADN